MEQNDPWSRLEWLRENVGDSKLVDILAAIASSDELNDFCDEVETELDICQEDEEEEDVEL